MMIENKSPLHISFFGFDIDHNTWNKPQEEMKEAET